MVHCATWVTYRPVCRAWGGESVSVGMRGRGGRAAAAALLTLGVFVLLPAIPAAASACSAGTMTIQWVGRGVTDTWFDRNNWQPLVGVGARLPGPGDNVCVDPAGPNITVTYDTNTQTSIKSIETHQALDISTGEL